MNLSVIKDTEQEPTSRSVSMTNDEWLVISQALECFSDSFRRDYSATVATYVTRRDLEGAVREARKMEDLLHRLDAIRSLLF